MRSLYGCQDVYARGAAVRDHWHYREWQKLCLLTMHTFWKCELCLLTMQCFSGTFKRTNLDGPWNPCY
jgi:hypothetical protein